MNYLIPLEVKGLTVAYGRLPALYNITFQIPKGKLVGIVGPNGAGKSSLIKAIMGLIPIHSGAIQVFGLPLKKALRHIGYVPQKESVDWDFPINVFDVVMMGRYGHLGLLKKPTDSDRAIVNEALKKVHMEQFANRHISELSGGQQQRIFLARALAQESDLYFLDEPFAGVDAATEHAIVAVLSELKQNEKTLLVVHHDLTTAPVYFDYLILLNKQLIAYGPTEEVFTLDNLQKAYEGKLNTFTFKNNAYIVGTKNSNTK